MNCKDFFCNIFFVKKTNEMSFSCDSLYKPKYMPFNENLSKSLNYRFCQKCENTCQNCQQRLYNNNRNFSSIRRQSSR